MWWVVSHQADTWTDGSCFFFIVHYPIVCLKNLNGGCPWCWWRLVPILSIMESFSAICIFRKKWPQHFKLNYCWLPRDNYLCVCGVLGWSMHSTSTRNQNVDGGVCSRAVVQMERLWNHFCVLFFDAWNSCLSFFVTPSRAQGLLYLSRGIFTGSAPGGVKGNCARD